MNHSRRCPRSRSHAHGSQVSRRRRDDATTRRCRCRAPASSPGWHSDRNRTASASRFSSARVHARQLSIPIEAEAFDRNPDRWTNSETGGLDPNAFAEPERIEYPTFDDRKIPAFVYRPSARKFPGPRPVLIDIHGGPEGQFRPGFIGRLNYLVDELGLVLIFPNVRGSSGYGKTYLKLDNGKLRADAVKDIGALLDWIATQKDLDKSRVGVTGGSYGGFMSLAVQTNYNDRIKAGIDIVGISNFVSFLQNTQGYRRDLRRAEYGDERDPEMRSFLERISPLTQRRQDPHADPDRPGPERPAGADLRVAADGRRAPEEQGPGLVRRRHQRGPRLRQEGQPGLSPGRRGRVPPPIPAGDRQ